MAADPLRIGLVDDHAVVRAGYRRFLELEGMVIALEAETAERADAELRMHERFPLDVLVVDISLPARSGLELTRRVCQRWPQARVLIFSMHDDAATVSQCLRAGASGYVTKSSAPDLMVKAVLAVARGGTVLSPDVAAFAECRQNDPHAALSAREFGVLNALLDGVEIGEIARRMSLSPKTVANYQTNIRQKLGVVGPLDLLAHARRHGLRD